ncbi:S-adenosyl-L-methionine-dependent methyltransferase [Trichodelitschia bisporula]|uniref:S-adenosyl-L-methionine-dependent methyltransferase n=1 Tax=Trichodelitschia bisporula TaxID=703511 RepID=A0A6G1HMC0_9PEZI|nr:S-adenosyl-L-methionine-dependent methyltransferase [Trichodelitschia bisporula]
MATPIERGSQYEEQHVHAVYEEIASHFSSTRYKPWPLVESFLTSLPAGAVGLDLGCGNGKYLTVNRDVFIVGSDRSPNLVRFAVRHEPHAAVVADVLDLPHPRRRFDFAISVAVVHHLSTPERRIEAIRAILDVLTLASGGAEGGRALIYVWALEQKGSRRGWDEGHEQDIMVPWITKGPKSSGQEEKTYQRYYHLYRKGELEEDVVKAGGKVLSSGYERDNWWAIATPEGLETVI